MQHSFQLTPIRPIPVHELVLEELKRVLESGQFRPGDRLPSERDMAEQLNVSRTTVRTAVGVLESEGLLSVKRGRGGGFVVLSPESDLDKTRLMISRNRQEIRAVFEYRAVVESAAARLAAIRRTETDIVTFRVMLEGMRTHLTKSLEHPERNHTAEFLAIDAAFHVGVASAARNSYLLHAVEEVRRYMREPFRSLFVRLEETENDFHNQIFDAIVQKDGDLAAEMMNKHIYDAMNKIEKT